MIAVDSTEGLGGISVIDSAAKGISSSIIPVSDDRGRVVEVVCAVGSAFLITVVLLGRWGERSARLVDLVAISFTWSSAYITTVR